jgi:hypothetical protein
MRKNNYPKHRKTRDVSYSKSYKLLHAVGEEKLKELFSNAGMYIVAKQASELLGYEVSASVTRYCRKRYNLGRKNEEATI